jgi:hypothetical protein
MVEKTNFRSSFSLIEVIFSIVIFATIFGTIPTLIQSVNRANENSLTKDIMFHMNSKLYQMLSFPWDENSKRDIFSFSHFLDINSSHNPNIYFNRNSETNVTRNSKSIHRLFYNDKTFISEKLGLEKDENLSNIDDMDDFNNYIYSFSTVSKNYNLAVKIEFIKENFNFLTDERLEILLQKTVSNTPTNIKKLTILTDDSSIKFEVLTTNIGESEFKNKIISN